MASDRAAILWDLDGTLVDSEPLHEAALVQALHSLGICPPDDFHRYIVGRDAREVQSWCREHFGLALSLRDWQYLKYRSHFASATKLKPGDGAVDLFKHLVDEDYGQAIVPSSDRLVVNTNLDAVGLCGPGQITVSRNDVHDGKPRPDPYLRAAWLLRADLEGCLVVEDSVTGAQSGHAARRRTDD